MTSHCASYLHTKEVEGCSRKCVEANAKSVQKKPAAAAVKMSPAANAGTRLAALYRAGPTVAWLHHSSA